MYLSQVLPHHLIFFDTHIINNLIDINFILCGKAMCELGVESVETLLLALPENLQGEENLKVLKGFWEVSLHNQEIYITHYW